MENLSRERALELHRQMWSEMKEEFGDNPSQDERYDFKREWIYNHFPNENVAFHALHDFFAHFIHGLIPAIKIRHHQPYQKGGE